MKPKSERTRLEFNSIETTKQRCRILDLDDGQFSGRDYRAVMDYLHCLREKLEKVNGREIKFSRPLQIYFGDLMEKFNNDPKNQQKTLAFHHIRNAVLTEIINTPFDVCDLEEGLGTLEVVWGVFDSQKTESRRLALEHARQCSDDECEWCHSLIHEGIITSCEDCGMIDFEDAPVWNGILDGDKMTVFCFECNPVEE